MLKNIKINQVLWGAAILILSIMSITSVLTYMNISKVDHSVNKQRNILLPSAFSFIDLKIDVIQVQQWLTDVSATRAHDGFDDGFDEAKSYFNNGNEILDRLILEHLKRQDMQTVQNLKTFKSDFLDFYNIGIKMANVYIKDGATAGNKMMLKLDPFAEKLSLQLDKWVDGHKKENFEMSNIIKDEIDSVESQTVLSTIILFIIVIIAFVGIANTISKVKTIHAHLKRLEQLDFSQELHLEGKNEISEIADSLNVVTQEISKVLSTINRTSLENVAISEELTKSSDIVGENIEYSRQIVLETTESTVKIQDEISSYVEGAKKTKDEVIQASEKLDTARDEIIILTQKVQETSEIEIELTHKIQTLSQEAEQVKEV